jgi:hypothetical protein
MQERSKALEDFAALDAEGQRASKAFLLEAREKTAKGFKLEEIGPNEWVWVKPNGLINDTEVNL